MAKAIHQTAIYNMCAWLGIWEAFHLVIDSYIHVRPRFSCASASALTACGAPQAEDSWVMGSLPYKLLNMALGCKCSRSLIFSRRPDSSKKLRTDAGAKHCDAILLRLYYAMSFAQTLWWLMALAFFVSSRMDGPPPQPGTLEYNACVADTECDIDDWTEEHLEAMRVVGNTNAEAYWCYNIPVVRRLPLRPASQSRR